MRQEVVMAGLFNRRFCRHSVRWSEQRQAYACDRCGVLVNPAELSARANWLRSDRQS